jgi:DNA-binding NarL/FixJ family response regulator
MHVVLTDDDAVMRAVLRSLLAEHANIEVVGDAADGHDAIEHARELGPAILVMDVVLPGMSGIKAMRQSPAVRAADWPRCESPVMRPIGPAP